MQNNAVAGVSSFRAFLVQFQCSVVNLHNWGKLSEPLGTARKNWGYSV